MIYHQRGRPLRGMWYAPMRYLRVCNNIIYLNIMRSAAGLALKVKRTAPPVRWLRRRRRRRRRVKMFLRVCLGRQRLSRQRPCFALRRYRTRAHTRRVVLPNCISLKIAPVAAERCARNIIRKYVLLYVCVVRNQSQLGCY